MPEKTSLSMDFVATVLMAVVFLASPIIITAADSSANEDPIKCTPCLPNPPPPPSPPPPSCPPPPPPSPPPPSPPKVPDCPPPPKELYSPPPSTPPSPPPPPTYVYPSSPPRDLYPVDHDFGTATVVESFTTVVLLLIAFGVVGLVIL